MTNKAEASFICAFTCLISRRFLRHLALGQRILRLVLVRILGFLEHEADRRTHQLEALAEEILEVALVGRAQRLQARCRAPRRSAGSRRPDARNAASARARAPPAAGSRCWPLPPRGSFRWWKTPSSPRRCARWDRGTVSLVGHCLAEMPPFRPFDEGQLAPETASTCPRW